MIKCDRRRRQRTLISITVRAAHARHRRVARGADARMIGGGHVVTLHQPQRSTRDEVLRTVQAREGAPT
jgi:hypothetical protein